MCVATTRIRLSVKHKIIYYLDWQHVSTLQGHHQAFIVNQLMFIKSCVHSWDPKQCLQLANVKHKHKEFLPYVSCWT